ncbi:hypothetical protein [Alicyclobacillus fodiniaquatilis]|uniref:Uracil DNA glycosylase superfamily protein n=1 Tax=Alicyclobacillus fodiniaquatilis TaxID=1661150 RepID=A0ABW4JFT2_9BACL
MNDATTFYAIIDSLAKNYEVQDIILPTSTCIFLLESPHRQEVRYKAPVAGSSGATMSKHIFGSEYAKFPLGLMVKKNALEKTNRPRLNGIGLLNVCNVPLQRSAYEHPALTERLRDWFDAMEYVRTNNQKDTFADARQQEVQTLLVQQLKDKLQMFSHRSMTLIPCGRFAQKFLRLTGLSDPLWQVIDDVPHPSYNSWDRAGYQPQVQAVCKAVEQAAVELK